MTRPIFEPSLQRKDAELGFGRNQLFRRPAPQAAASTMPGGYIAWTVGADITNATWTDPGDVSGDWESFVNASGTGIITASLTGGTITANQGTTDYLWRAHAIASWQDTPAAGTVGLRILPSASGVPVANPTSERWQDSLRVLTDGAIGAVTHDSVHLATASSITFSALVWQNTGGNLFLNFLILYIWAEGDWTTANGTFDP